MKRLASFLLILHILTSCSSPSRTSPSRAPGSVSEVEGCYEMASQIVGNKRALSSQRTQRLNALDTDWVDEVPEFKELVFLNRSPKLRQRSRQVMSLLREHYPEESNLDLVRRYRRLFKECA